MMYSSMQKMFVFSNFITKRFKSSLVIVEHNNEQLNPITRHAITAAKSISDVTCLLAGHKTEKVLSELAKIDGVKKILTTDKIAFKDFLPEAMVPLINMIQKNNQFAHILAGSSSFSRNIMPRLAATLDVSALSDVTQIASENKFVRNVYAGNAITSVESTEPVKVLTIRATAFEAANSVENNKKPEIENVDFDFANDKSKYISSELSSSDRPELSSAKTVISGGRGMKNAENFKILYELADKLNAAVGASRAAVDSGFVPNELQIGQTGKIVAPELYIAVGISGAIQHLAGMKDSKTIVAINKDPEAPIFQVSDYGIVDDLFKVVPEMTKLLKEAK